METAEKVHGGIPPVSRESLCKSLLYLEEEKVKAVAPLEKELAALVEKQKAAAAVLAAIAADRARVEGELHAKKIHFSTKIGPLKRQLSANPPESATRVTNELRGLLGDYGKKIETSSEYFPRSNFTTIYSSERNVRGAQACLEQGMRKIWELTYMPFFGEEFEEHLSKIKEAAINEAEGILARPMMKFQVPGRLPPQTIIER